MTTLAVFNVIFLSTYRTFTCDLPHLTELSQGGEHGQSPELFIVPHLRGDSRGHRAVPGGGQSVQLQALQADVKIVKNVIVSEHGAGFNDLFFLCELCC